MYQAIKLTSQNISALAEHVSPLVYEEYKMEFEWNTEDGITTYATRQDYIGSNGHVLVYLYTESEIREMFKNADDIDTTEFKDVITPERKSR